VQLTVGSLRVFQAFLWLRAYTVLKPSPRSAPPQLTLAVRLCNDFQLVGSKLFLYAYDTEFWQQCTGMNNDPFTTLEEMSKSWLRHQPPHQQQIEIGDRMPLRLT